MDLGQIDIPRKQVVDPVDGMVGDARQDVLQIRFGIHPVQFGRADEAVDRCRPLAAGVGSSEEIILPAHSNSAGTKTALKPIRSASAPQPKFATVCDTRSASDKRPIFSPVNP